MLTQVLTAGTGGERYSVDGKLPDILFPSANFPSLHLSPGFDPDFDLDRTVRITVLDISTLLYFPYNTTE